INPSEAPGVGTPVAGGLAAASLAAALACLEGRPDLAAIELVEYSPRLDPDGATAEVAIDLLAGALCGRRGLRGSKQQAQVVSHTLGR
ncbi:MAG: arginase family protein, partial [Betaproteobacteria bacterium]|nr:arginase family protein [Betaproteobacteria bacterium]